MHILIFSSLYKPHRDFFLPALKTILPLFQKNPVFRPHGFQVLCIFMLAHLPFVYCCFTQPQCLCWTQNTEVCAKPFMISRSIIMIQYSKRKVSGYRLLLSLRKVFAFWAVTSLAGSPYGAESCKLTITR